MNSLNKLNNEDLVKTYISANKYKLSAEFIELLEKEIYRRNISIHSFPNHFL
ncbi:sporulation histidine kinase inhibitor Sda [Niallia sp. NCCP-28]|uniref:sporulation histidine kinase inhibitor Sda n=1 Tax=Niallia sp. NCCP-28 TaxID=2934712 RepID=UPI00207F6F73|nr:sporulation histidine kinase inhibitor Sda [Niallia sp. NCCP-28]GKU84008.1 hypothetical protein NCCP28_34040 [Niallia sp. NCCP-28]